MVTSKVLRKYIKLYKDDPSTFPSPFQYEKLDNLAQEMGKEAFNKEKEKVAQELKSSQLESSDALPDNIKIWNASPYSDLQQYFLLFG